MVDTENANPRIYEFAIPAIWGIANLVTIRYCRSETISPGAVVDVSDWKNSVGMKESLG
jgi:hypothetical protein